MKEEIFSKIEFLKADEMKLHIRRFIKPEHAALKPPHNMPLYHDVHTFFKELFEKKPLLYVHYFNAELLMEDLKDRFDGKYDVEQIRRMLDMGYFYSLLSRAYVIKREDFIKEVKK